MSTTGVLLLLFQSTRDVIKAERACNKAAIPVDVVPVPRSISSECGMALEIAATSIAAALKSIEPANIPVTVVEYPQQ